MRFFSEQQSTMDYESKQVKMESYSTNETKKKNRNSTQANTTASTQSNECYPDFIFSHLRTLKDRFYN